MKSQIIVIVVTTLLVANILSLSIKTNLANAAVTCVDKYNYASVIPCSDQNAIAAPTGGNMKGGENVTSFRTNVTGPPDNVTRWPNGTEAPHCTNANMTEHGLVCLDFSPPNAKQSNASSTTSTAAGMNKTAGMNATTNATTATGSAPVNATGTAAFYNTSKVEYDPVPRQPGHYIESTETSLFMSEIRIKISNF